MTNPKIHVVAFYRFLPLEKSRLEDIRKSLETYAEAHKIRGLFLLGEEGINSTSSGTAEAIAGFKRFVSQLLDVNDIFFKDSVTNKHPFHTFKVKIKDEIVTLGRPGMTPDRTQFFHLSPDQWDEAMQEPDTVVIDTRNDYEVEIGKFKNAIDFNIKEFRDFPERLKESGIAKDKKVLIYCTGGIRCEKAILEMHNQGYQKVYQLDGGILNYLEKRPNQSFEGECFVFDYRVAVDQSLQPSNTYRLCPHCGQPANVKIDCAQCGSEAVICHHCVNEQKITTCSKNCAHHLAIGSRSRRPHLQERAKRHGL